MTNPFADGPPNLIHNPYEGATSSRRSGPRRPERRTVSQDYTLEQIDRERTLNKLRKSNPKFTKTTAAVAEFKKHGISYPDNITDKAFNDFLERTRDGKGNEYAHKNRTIITAITRRQVTPGKEYLTWNEMVIRYSPLGNPEFRSKLNLGQYPIIEMKNVMRQDETGYKHVETVPTGTTRTGYYLEYNLKNIDKLHEQAIDDYEYLEVTDKERVEAN